MSDVPNRYNWDFCGNSQEFTKDNLINSHLLYMFERTFNMFDYQGLPETIPKKELERLIQMNGYAIITKVDGKLYAFSGGLGGVPNVYYRPTTAIVSNPALNFSKDMEIHKECELILNDSFYVGLTPLFSKYATLLAEIELSFRLGVINSRLLAIISTDNDNAKTSAEDLFKKIEDGELAGVVGGKAFFENVDTQTFGADKTNGLKSLVEVYQYLKSQWLNSLGISSNWNSKKENLNEEEINDDDILPLILSMKDERIKGVEAINKLYGTSITVDFSEHWKKKVDEILENNAEGKEGDINDKNENE